MFEINLTNKVAWITGASRGIGRATAVALAKAGCQVIIGYHSNQKEAENVAIEIENLKRKVLLTQLDIKQLSSCQRAYDQIKKTFDGIDILVNNAAITRDNLFMMLDSSDWQNVIETNLMGTVNVTNLVLRDMMLNKFGRIINMSSVAATKGGRGQANYAASKAAIEAMTRCLAVEVSAKNITVNCLAPGVIETAMSAEVRKLAGNEILARQLINRFGNVDEIAAWVVFLASDYASFMTGQTIHVDGGFLQG